MDGVPPDPVKQRAFGKGVVACRERLLLSRDAFAERIGISTRYLRKIESGRARPSSDVVFPILADFEPADFDNFRVFLRVHPLCASLCFNSSTSFLSAFNSREAWPAMRKAIMPNMKPNMPNASILPSSPLFRFLLQDS